jgi:hypothetical protein
MKTSGTTFFAAIIPILLVFSACGEAPTYIEQQSELKIGRDWDELNNVTVDDDLGTLLIHPDDFQKFMETMMIDAYSLPDPGSDSPSEDDDDSDSDSQFKTQNSVSSPDPASDKPSSGGGTPTPLPPAGPEGPDKSDQE